MQTNYTLIYRVAQKVNNCLESSSNRIKNRQCGYILIKFEYKMSARTL